MQPLAQKRDFARVGGHYDFLLVKAGHVGYARQLYRAAVIHRYAVRALRHMLLARLFFVHSLFLLPACAVYHMPKGKRLEEAALPP